jgi:hypothetical protein
MSNTEQPNIIGIDSGIITNNNDSGIITDSRGLIQTNNDQSKSGSSINWNSLLEDWKIKLGNKNPVQDNTSTESGIVTSDTLGGSSNESNSGNGGTSTDVLLPSSTPPSNSGTSPSNSGKTYYVALNGNDSNPGTIDKPWRTINYATSNNSSVSAGDTILVQPGTYTELITLGKSGDDELGHITLKANGNVTLLDPDPINGDFREGVIQSANMGYWVIDGFEIKNTSWAGIALSDANNMIVQNNRTYETGASGIIVLPENYYGGGEAEVTSRDIKVLNNTIERANWRWSGRGDTKGSQEALSIWGVNGFEVAYNTVNQGNREGIDVKTGSRNGSVHNNTVTGAALVSGTPNGYNGGPAIYVDGNRAATFNVDIYNNLIYNNTADAIAVADEDPNNGDVSNIRIYNNVVYGNGIQGINGGLGIAIDNNVRNVEVVNNTFVNNVRAFGINGDSGTGGYRPTNILLRNNIFANSTYWNGSNGYINNADKVTLDNNLFTGNYQQLYESGNGNSNLNAVNNRLVSSAEFVNFNNNDFRLTAASPAIDSGSSSIGQYAQTDKNGVTRNQGAGVDIGAYEYKP